jgi:hypothetical protein
MSSPTILKTNVLTHQPIQAHIFLAFNSKAEA